MGQRILVTEQETNDIRKLYNLLITEEAGGLKFEYVYDLPNSTIEQVNGSVKRNPSIRSGTRLVTDNPNQLVYTKKIRLDGPYKKVAKMNSLPNTCIDGELEFDMTFLIKDNKVKLIIDNIIFNARRIYVGNSPCSDCFNYGFIGSEPNPQSVGGKLLCDKSIIWNRLVNIITPNMQNFSEEIRQGFTNTQGVKDDYDF